MFTTPHFLRNLRIGSINWCLCPWQAFPADCNVSLQLTGPIRKLRRTWSVVNTDPVCIWQTCNLTKSDITAIFILPHRYRRYLTGGVFVDPNRQCKLSLIDSLHWPCIWGDNAGDSDTRQPLLYLPWPPWVLGQRYDHFYWPRLVNKVQ